MLAPDFVLVQVFHLVGKMLEGKIPMPSLEVAQVITKPSMEKDLLNLRAKLVAEAIVVFDKGVLQQAKPLLLSNTLLTTGVAYLANVATRSVYECLSIQPDMV